MHLYACRRTVNTMAETHDKRTETHACDYISRQAAIEAITDLPTW